MNGLRSLSIDQLLSLKIDAFSVLKRESKDVVACRFMGDNLLCSDKNCCFLDIFERKATFNYGKLQIVFFSSLSLSILIIHLFFKKSNNNVFIRSF